MRKWTVEVGFHQTPRGDYYDAYIQPMPTRGSAVPTRETKTFAEMVSILYGLGLSDGNVEYVRRELEKKKEEDQHYAILMDLEIAEGAAAKFGWTEASPLPVL